MGPDEKAGLLENWALEEGFDRAGVAALRPSEHGEALARWLARGDHGRMAYMERRRDARLDPRRLLEGARSALCVALQYHPLDGEPSPEGDLWPFVARYARGQDYHLLMERRLERLARRVETAFPGTGTRLYVDTGPILERELAARAGLGAIGKNTNLLHPEAGSWFLLGELLTTLELGQDPTVAELCGSCTACLEACPTGALPEPYRLDSRRCISYWTIEHRGVIPAEVRGRLGRWVFGCDICQEVCPVNADPPGARHDELRLPTSRRPVALSALLSLDRQDYLERFRGSPMKRAKLEGLQRNAAVAMGNSGDPRYIDDLAAALSDGGSLVRRHAAWALGRIGGPEARGILRELLESETDRAVILEAREALE